MINNIENDKQNYFWIIDTNIIIYYFQWTREIIKISDQEKCEFIRKIISYCLDNNIILRINKYILDEIKNVSNKKFKNKLYIDYEFLKKISNLDNLNKLKELSDNYLSIIYDWKELENKIDNDFNSSDMKIYFLEQIRYKGSLNKNIVIYTEDIHDFYVCKKVYLKYYKKYDLSYTFIKIKHFRELDLDISSLKKQKEVK